MKCNNDDAILGKCIAKKPQKICVMIVTKTTSDGLNQDNDDDKNRWKSLNLVFTYNTNEK